MPSWFDIALSHCRGQLRHTAAMTSALVRMSSAGHPHVASDRGYDTEHVIFDEDDPDFDAPFVEVSIRHSKSDPLIVSQHQRVHHYASSEVDRASYPACWSLLECDQQFHSLEDLQKQDTSMLTIEGLRSLYNSCFTCGVSWYEDHVSLDCSECGGYAMQRPCPECDGRCESAWRRDVAASHESRKARWEGTCSLLVTNPGERKKPTRQQLTVKAVEEASLAKAMEALKTPL